MSFGIINAPASFMDVISRIYELCLNQYVVVFVNDMLIYSKNKKEHEEHLSVILQTLREKQLYAKFKKCKF